MVHTETDPLSPISALFRFRDLVAETLKEHRAVIRDQGYCWWGWWKRPSENARGEIWDALSRATLGGGEVRVGLFDSGSGEMYPAIVSGIVAPTDAAASKSPPLEAEELKRVPAYYRESPFSRGWLRVKSISETPEQIFGNYSYAGAPPLPGIAPDMLMMLDGKTIVDATELRSMDTTIWQVKLGTGGRSDHFLAPSCRVFTSVSKSPVALRGSSILHLTDLHFDKRPANAPSPEPRGQHIWDRPASRPLVDMIGMALDEETKAKIGLIVVSGDLTMVGDAQEFKVAERCIRGLMGVLDLGTDHVVVCPGNHDVCFSVDGGRRFDKDRDVGPAEATGGAKANYRRFYSDLLGHSPNQDFSMGRRYVLPNGRLLEIASLNSCRLEQGPDFLAGMGSVGPTAFTEVADGLGWSEREATPSLRLLVLHHHVRQVEEVLDPAEYAKGFGLAIDAPEVMRTAARRGVRLVLHGHRHRPFFWREEVFETQDRSIMESIAHVAIAGGGSAGSTDTRGEENFFQVIDVEAQQVRLRLFMSRGGRAFTNTRTNVAEIEYSKSWLSLGPWRSE